MTAMELSKEGSESLESFLNKLRHTGKLSESECKLALALACKTQTLPEHFTIPGNVTLRKACAFGELAAVAAVFNTPELAENIFSNLRDKDLARGVALTCRGFRTYVYSSLSLRRKLFLEPDRTVPVEKPRLPKLSNLHYCISSGYVETLWIRLQQMMERYPHLHNMYTQQPPITAIDVTYECTIGTLETGLISNKDGITYGIVWKAISDHLKYTRRQKSATLDPSMHIKVLEAHLMSRIPPNECGPLDP